MNLDNPQQIIDQDLNGFLRYFAGWPSQLVETWQQALTFPLPDQTWRTFRTVVIAGWGEAITPAILLKDLLHGLSPIHIVILQHAQLPAWMTRNCLLVLVTPLGGEPEIQALHDQAQQRHIPTIVLAYDKHLTIPTPILWEFSPHIGHHHHFDWIFCYLLALLNRLEGSDSRKELQQTEKHLTQFKPVYGVENPAATNPAKRQAGQFTQRLPVMVGGGIFSGVAYRWKCRLNTLAQSWAGYEMMPEANFSSINALELPAFLMPKVIGMFIRSTEYDRPLLSKRYDLTLQLLLENGIGTDSFYPSGPTPLAQVLQAVLYSDYVSFYTALANGVDVLNERPYSNAITHFLKEDAFTP